MRTTFMPFDPVPADKILKSNDALGTASLPPPSASSPSKSTASVHPVPFSLLGFGIFHNGGEVEVRFSDQSFVFLTRWLYSSRKNEGLPSPDGVKNPSRIRVRSVKITGVGIRAVMNITWNTGTTSQFPALWLRVLGPRTALEQACREQQLPVPGGKNPQSGVEQLTLDEKRVARRYRAMLMEVMKVYMGDDWLEEAPTSLLREMVRYSRVEEQSQSVTAQAAAAEAMKGAATADLSDDDSLIDEEEMSSD